MLNDEENLDMKNEENKKRVRTFIPKTHNLPHPNIKFDQQLKMLKAYVLATNKGNKGIKYKELKGMVDFSLLYISATNKFFEEIGLLEKRHGQGIYSPTKKAIEFQNYLDWNNDFEAKETLKDIIENSWFWESAKQVLIMSDGKASKDDIIRKMGLDSQADPKRHQLCFRSMIDYLKYTELINEDDEGMLIMTDSIFEKIDAEDEIVNYIKKDNDVSKEDMIETTRPVTPFITEPAKKYFPDLSDAMEFRYKSGLFLKIIPNEENIELLSKILEVIGKLKVTTNE